jgi:membrane protein
MSAREREDEMNLKAFVQLSKEAVSEWSADNASRLSAALAYYTIFSIAPLLIIILGITGLIFGDEAGRGQVMEQLGGVMGPEGASAIQDILKGAQHPTSGIIATIISFVVLAFTASGVFYELHNSLNTIWDVQRKSEGGIFNVIKTRLPSFSILPVLGFILIVSLVVSTALASFGGLIGNILPGAQYMLYFINFVISFLVIAFLFALIYKILPDVEIRWRDVWVGAAVTSLLFVIGKFAIGLYLGKSGIASTYGAAGSLVILLAWVYYSAQIFFFGAEVTQVYANKFGSKIVPSAEAEPLPREEPSAENYPSQAGTEKGRPAEAPSSRPAPAHFERQEEGRRQGPSTGQRAASSGAPDTKKDESGEVRPKHPITVAVMSFIGGILTAVFLSRPQKPA